ncbi:MAG: rRNA maturation RNase YbeY [Gemmatimonadetes bacterium]|nr:rRNA maturation RNase YbeY [Gemmatimonadota bacterium]
MTTASAGLRPALPPSVVRRAVAAVLDGEGTGPATVSVTFLSVPRMRALNRRSLGHDRATDVIAFRLSHGAVVTGDIYICPAKARAAARELDLPEREELVRLVVHGTLHVLGFDHPAGVRRVDSPMWRRQERYVRRLVRRAA